MWDMSKCANMVLCGSIVELCIRCFLLQIGPVESKMCMNQKLHHCTLLVHSNYLNDKT